MTRALREPGRAGLAALLALVALGAAAPRTMAADPVLPRPTATVRFLQDITFAGTATLAGAVHRTEIVIMFEGSSRSFTAEVAPAGSTGQLDLTYVLETPGGSIAPNSQITARFRATLDDGSLVDGPSVEVRYDDTRYDWQVLSGDVVTIHWTEGGQAFGRRALGIADDAVRNVSDLLGVTESDPIDFFVYADRNAFYDVLGAGARENVGGEAHTDIRTLFANIAPSAVDAPWVGMVIPHELTHLVFDTAVANPYHYPPRWLNEGVAVYLSEGFTDARRQDLEAALRSGTLLPLHALVGQFPTTADQFYLAYAESISAVDFLVRQYGRDAMVDLVRSYGHGVTDDEAFASALGIDVAGFEGDWLTSIGAPLPSAYGPIDAPPGPVPSDWLGEGPLPGEIPEGSRAPAPSASTAPGFPGEPDAGDGTGLLVVLILVGLATAGLGLWLARRNRPGGRASSPGANATTPAATPAPSPEEHLPKEPPA